MKLVARNTPRDLGYFYVGLIIAFAFSGIFLNHRNVWHPSDYKYNAEPVKVEMPAGGPDEAFVAQLSKTWELENQFKGFQIRGNTLRITYKDYMADIDLSTGEGVKESYFKVPILAQSTFLHQTTNGAWVWYSDIFGIAMLTIACTGMFIQRGKMSFRQRGWKFALAGIVFPLIFLFLIA